MNRLYVHILLSLRLPGKKGKQVIFERKLKTEFQHKSQHPEPPISADDLTGLAITGPSIPEKYLSYTEPYECK